MSSKLRAKLANLNVNAGPIDLNQSFELTQRGTLVYQGYQIKDTGITHAPSGTGNSGDLQDIKEESSQAVVMGRTISRKDCVEYGDLGVGQNGVVRKALYLPELDIVAIKAVNLYDRSKRHQMIKEIEGFHKIQNKYVVRLVGAYMDNDKGNLVMALEYMNRGSLKQLVQRHGAMSESVLRSVCKQACTGLYALHKKNRVHRDIKPDNILCDHAGRVKISDFGLLREVADSHDASQTFVGTLLYLSPERITGDKYTFPSDVWSWGITLIYCATGDLPKEYKSEYWAMVTQVAQKEPPHLDATKFSAPFCDFVNKCLLKDPEKRWTAAQLLKHPWLQGAGGHADASEWPFSRTDQHDLEDMKCVNKILLDHNYADGKFTNSLFDMTRFSRIGAQLGLPVKDVSRDFRRQFHEKFPDVQLTRTPSAAAASSSSSAAADKAAATTTTTTTK